MKRIRNIINSLVSKLTSIFSRRKVYAKKTLVFIQRKPFTSFFAVLAVFFILMVLGNLLFSPKIATETKNESPKMVKIYKIGGAPQVSYQGKIEKSGVIKIVAQTSGIVSSINVLEGQEVGQGTNILSLSSNYQGGNAPSIQRQLALTQYNNAKDTFATQGDIIGKQKELANKNHDNAEILRQITSQSAADTRALVDLNETIVDALASNIQTLEQTNVGGSNDAAILQAKQQLLQFQSATLQANSSLRSLELQAAEDQPPSQMASLQHDISVEQLELQRKALDLNLEVSKLSYNLALVSEANMFPSSPFAGTVDKIFVSVGDNVTSGTVLASISGLNQHAEIVVSVPQNIAKNVSVFEPSTLTIGNKNVEMMATYVSKDATSGVLYSIIYQLDDSFTSSLTDSAYVLVKVPIGVGDTTNSDPFIPLDSVVQTQDEAYVYIVDDKNVARVRKINLGQIQGRYVEVVSGLPKNAQIIVDRNVIEGDKVSVVR